MMIIAAITTRSYIWAAYALVILSLIIDLLGKLIPYGAYQLTTAVEWTVMVLFSLSYVMLWVLLVVGPLRPRCLFTRRGDKGKQMANFLYALGGLFAVHAFVAFKIATAAS